MVYDPRVTFTGSASILGGFRSIGGNTVEVDVGGTMSFAPVDPVTGAKITFDTVELILASSTENGGTFNVKTYDASNTLKTTSATQNNNNVNTTKKITLTVDGTSTKLTITTLTGTCFVQAIGVRMSTKQGIEFINCSANGQDLTTFNTWQRAMYATCLANDIPYIDPPAAFPTSDVMNTFGYYGDGGWHLGSDGQAIVARMMLEAFESVV